MRFDLEPEERSIGEFFDVNPGKRRSGRPSRFRQYVRFSFGPEEAAVIEGIGRIQGMVRELC